MGKRYVLIAASLLAALGHFVSCSAVAAMADPTEQARTVSAVRQMMLAIPADLAQHGPTAWLHYFDDDRRFLMAVDGTLQFDGIASANAFLHPFAKGISHIELTWAEMRIDPLAPGIASIASAYREVLTDARGHANAPRGYFTAVAIQTPTGWKLRAVHWSSLPAAPPGG
jgi:hypothetical protein